LTVHYGDQWNNYLTDPYQLNYKAIGAKTDEYCAICNPFQYDTSIMMHAAIRKAHLKDTIDLYRGGGYYDSGCVQPLDFFGDGPRVPLIVSPYTKCWAHLA
jgi:hypothetical protein